MIGRVGIRRPAGLRAGAAGALLAMAFWAAAPHAGASALPGAAEGAALAPVLRAAEAEDWATARSLAARVGDPAAATLATWLTLSRGQASFADYAAFLAQHPDWPGRDRLRRRAEQAMPAGLPARQVRAFFEDRPPLTGAGALRLAEALRAEGREAEARAEAARAWTTLSLEGPEEAALAAEFASALTREVHLARLDMLLWRGLGAEALRMAPRVDAGHAALARARAALRADQRDGINALIDAVPAALAGDPGLAYERFRWRAARGNDAGALELLRAASAAGEAGLGRPALWADRRARYARQAAREGNPRLAYELASRHYLKPTDGYDYADLEWIAGWVALRQLRDPATAERHFERFIAAVNTPISYGRGHYWLGRARADRGDRAGARAAWAEGARHQTSFYGQLAAEAAGIGPDPQLAHTDPPTDWMSATVLSTPLVRAGVMAHWAGDRALSNQLLVHAARQAANPRHAAALGHLALELDRPEVAVRIAKAAAGNGIVVPQIYYPVTGLARAAGPVRPAIALAIARQESELDPNAVSPAGARGLMQVMPATAEQVSRRLGLAYSRAALTEDWRYNARLGTEYIAGLIDEFGSLPLAAAGYNAGRGRVREWIERFGDPRGRPLEEVLDWLESIPFSETRNYVQRVLEGAAIYEARIAGRPVPLEAAARLR